MKQSREGQKVPSTVFRTRDGDRWVDVSSDDVFAGKTVVVFALPGAFTPTCSSTHLPRYEELAEDLAGCGVDDVVCVSVNDAFVMNAWRADQRAQRVRVLPDGNGEFTRAMGMLVDKSDLGFGPRSWRYSMLVRDGVIEKMFIEPEKAGDPFEVSDADTMLAYLGGAVGGAARSEKVVLFTRPGCPHCARAKSELERNGYRYEEIVVGDGASTRALEAVSGARTVPQVFVDGRLIGSADDLERWLQRDAAA